MKTSIRFDRQQLQYICYFDPLSPDIQMHILLTVLHIIISYGTRWENLHKNQVISSLMIICFILMTRMFDQVGIL